MVGKCGVILLIFLAGVGVLASLAIIPGALAQGPCPSGYVWSRGVIGCVQEHCPPGSGRLYSEGCSCWVEEWGGTPKVTCRDSKTGLVTHCLPQGQDCTEHPSHFDPVSGQCNSGFSLNQDKSDCVAGSSVQSPPSSVPSQSESSNSPAPPSSFSTSPNPSTASPSSPSQESGVAAPLQSPEQACTARPHTKFDQSTGRCGCQETFFQDLRRSGCVSQADLHSQCDKVSGASWDSSVNKCICQDSSLYPSGFTNTCVNAQTFGNQVCDTRVVSAVYDPAAKKCVCPPNTKPSEDKHSCVKDSPFGRACTDDPQCPGDRNRCDLESGTCGCRPPFRPSANKDACVTLAEYGNEACPKKFPGSIFDEANKKCKCPDGWKKSDDGKSCVAPETDNSCENDAKCPDDKKCDTASKRCVDVSCDCGEVKNHQCSPFACCRDDQCGQTQKCDDVLHSCEAVECPKGKVINHVCNENACSADRDCQASQKCAGEGCVEIECACGKIENHACNPYECCDTKPCTDGSKECDQTLHTCVDKGDVCKHFDTGPSSINLVFVPHGYAQAEAASFRATTQSVYNTLFATEPFKTNKAKVKVHRVEKFDENLDCNYFRAPGDPDDATLFRGITCDQAKMMALAGKCPVNFAFAVVNSNQYGGAAGGVGSSYGYMSRGTEPIGFVHEIGHMLGLEDEYSKGASGTAEWAANAPNCDSANDCEKWKALAGTECIAGCAYDNWKRSSTSGDVMKTLANKQFGPVSTRHLITKLG